MPRNKNKNNQQPHQIPTTGLDESPVSAYAKAVNAIRTINKQGHILMGYAPPLLRVLTDIDNLRTYTSYYILRKDMLGQGRNKHFIPAQIMLQVPRQMNNIIGILSSTPNTKIKGFVFVTDLAYKGNPIVIALHKEMPNKNELLTMVSCYDKKIDDFQKFLNYNVLCWDYSKAERFEEMWDGILDLPPHIYPTKDFGKQQRLVFSTETVLDSLSPPYKTVATHLLSHNTSPLFVVYDKAERYLSQYFPNLSLNPNLYLDAAKVQQIKEWTQQNAPINRQSAEQVLVNIYTQFMLPNETVKQAIQDEIKNELDAIYKQRHFITGKDLPLFHQKAQQFSEKYKQQKDAEFVKQLCQSDFALRKAALQHPEISQSLLERTAIHHKCPQTRKAAAAVLQQRDIEIPTSNKPNTTPSKTVKKDKGIEI